MTNSEDARLREVVQLVDELKASEARTAQLKARLSALLNVPTTNGVATPTPAKPAVQPPKSEEDEDNEDEDEQPADEAAAGSQRSRVLAVFKRQPGKKVAIDDVVKELSDIPANLVRSYASRFTKNDGPLKRVRRGVYRYVNETEE